MAQFPYTPTPAALKRFFPHIQSAGVPEKVTQKYLETVGFRTKNDRYTIGVLKFLGFLASDGTPTGVWQNYRNRSTARRVLGSALKRAYSDLFRTYPDAHRKDNEALRNYFSAHTKVAESTLNYIVATFKAVSELADFDGDVAAGPQPEPVVHVEPEAIAPVRVQVGTSGTSHAPTVNINIQLHLPATEDAEIYEKLFAAMRRHLFTE